MVPDLSTVRDDDSGGFDRTRRILDSSLERTFNGITNGNGNANANGNTAPPHNSQPDTQPAYSTTNSSEKGVFHSPPLRLNSNGTFWPPLKAVPLASYYKLHRVPSLNSLTAMAEAQNENRAQPIELPQSEPTHIEEPQDKSPPPPNGVHNKLLEPVIRTPGRQPSPQPTHLSVPGPGQHRVLPEQGSGYVAPIFEGKEQQMEQGKPVCVSSPLSMS